MFNKYFFIILSLPLILTFLWFKDGYLLGHAEGALPFYKLERHLEPTKYSWMEHPGLGNISLFTTSAKPTYVFLTFLQNNLGIPGFIIEATLLYFLITTAGIGIYLLTKEFFPELSNKYILLSVLFYWFSPLALTEVWNRFLINYIFFFSALPILLFTLVRGFNSKKYFYALLLTLLIGIYSYGLSALVFILLLWQIIVLITLFFLITERELANKWFYVKFVILLLIGFILTNSWWLTQAFTLKFQMPISETISNFSISENIYTLETLSNKLGNLTDIMRFINVSSSEIIGRWINYFNHPIAILLEFSIIAAIFITIIKNKRNRSVLILGSMLFVSLFLMKGINSPLGEIFKVFFHYLSFLQVFRNPFEKFSFMLNLIVALLFGYSVNILSTYIFTKTKKNIYSSTLYLFYSLIILFFSYPFFSGLVFTTNEPPTNDPKVGYKVSVPKYYEQASNFMESKEGNFRYIGFPIAPEGITYRWEKGYSGVDLSSTLFETPGILFNTVVPYYDYIVPQLENLFLENNDFLSIANSLNVRFFIHRADIDWQERSMKDPNVILERMKDLEKKGLIKKIGEYGLLQIWENLAWKDYTIYPADKVISFLPENISSYNTIPNTSSGETTIQGLPDKIISSNLLSKTIINTTLQPNVDNTGHETYSLDINKDGNYQISFENTSTYDPKIFIDKKLVVLNDKPLSNLDPLYLKQGRYQIVVNDLEESYMLDLSKGTSSEDSRGYFKNFEIDNFDPKLSYKVDMGNIPASSKDITIYMFHDNDRIRNSERISPLNKQIAFSNPKQTALNNLHPASIIFPPLPSSTKAWISFLSNNPLEVSFFNSLSIKKIVKPKPYFITTPTNNLSSHLPKLTYKKINPTKYTVHVSDASSPFVLVFSELFNNKWEAFYENNSSINPHMRTNSYANGWLIERSGNFDITIEFTPQRLYRAGELFSIGSHLINCIVLLFLIFKRKDILFLFRQKK